MTGPPVTEDGMPGKCDPDSQAMWDELRKYVTVPARGLSNPCCRKIIVAMENGLESCAIYSREGYLLDRLRLNHCPECGTRVR